MLQEIKKLLEVQEIDKEIIHLKETLARYPKVWEKVKEKLGSARAQNEQAVTAQDKFQRNRKRLEQKLRLQTDDLRRAQTQQNQVKTAKEYEAATKQLEHVKRQLEDLQKRATELLAQEDDIAQAVTDTTAQLEKMEETYKTEKVRIRSQFNEKKEQLAKLEKSREEQLSQVSPKTRQIYDRTAVRYPGNSIVPVVNEGKINPDDRGTNGCAGCHFEVLPEVLVEIRREEGIILCTNCGRILYEDETWEEESSAVG